jgi:hypothetical protein
MGKKTPVETTSESENLIKFFGKNFFSDPEIIDLKENSFTILQTDLSKANRQITGSDEHRYLTTVDGKIIRPLEATKPVIFHNRTFFQKPHDFLWSETRAFHSYLMDTYSGTMIIALGEKQYGLYPALLFKNSYTGSTATAVKYCLHHPRTKATLYRQSACDAKNIREEFLEKPDVFLANLWKFQEGTTRIISDLIHKKIKVSFLTKEICNEIILRGYPSRISRSGISEIANLTEEFNEPLNALTIYHGFNKVLFESPDKLTQEQRETIDARIFEYLITLKP